MVCFLPHGRIDDLLTILHDQGYQCIGPQVRDGAIVYDQLDRAEQLPWGVHEHQAPGKYRIERTSEHRAFLWANGPQAIKPYLFASEEILWKVDRDATGKLFFQETQTKPILTAIFGVRPCDIEAMLIQDKVFLEDKFVDTRYQQRRAHLLTIVMNCTHPSANCFCVSAGGNTKASRGYDIVMTELDNGFVVDPGSDKGKDILKMLLLEQASDAQQKIANQSVFEAAKNQTKKLPKGNLKEKLFANLEHTRWDDVAKRCLSCTNCTQVCPTCFCHSEVDRPNLDGKKSEHIRQWDSCFTKDHSYIVGHTIRPDTRTRYRQWLTHKLGSWHDQFGTSGCVGCGRCITWCPVGIDITEEAKVICEEKSK